MTLQCFTETYPLFHILHKSSMTWPYPSLSQDFFISIDSIQTILLIFNSKKKISYERSK